MKNGISRFNYFLDQFQALLNKAARQKNPALWLFQNNARTPLFMLEGLAKLYAGLHNKKKFGKLKEQFKLLEDGFGAVDYYDAFAKEFAADKKIPAALTGYLQAQAREKIESVNELLTEKGWLGDNNRRMLKIRKVLDEVDWKDDDKEIGEMNEFYGQSIYTIVEFAKQSKFHFTNVEADVHELRRKLRWLSIYPQALRGCIQLSKGRSMPAHLKKYLTPAITGSPYNKMPDAGGNRYFLMLEQHYFYSLSWMIAELGNLKDSGLRLIAIREALMQTTGAKEAAALTKAQAICGKKQPALKDILVKADALCKRYFTENNLEHLVMGTAGMKS